MPNSTKIFKFIPSPSLSHPFSLSHFLLCHCKHFDFGFATICEKMTANSKNESFFSLAGFLFHLYSKYCMRAFVLVLSSKGPFTKKIFANCSKFNELAKCCEYFQCERVWPDLNKLDGIVRTEVGSKSSQM